MELSPWPQEHERDQELIRRAVDSHESGSYEQRFLRPDGSTGYYLSSYQGCYDANGRLTSIVGTIQDITERKLAEQERERLQEQLAQAQKMETIGRLAGGVAHDFNNILTAIAGNAELALLCGDLDPKTTRRLKDIEQAAASAACLTRQLLAFSRKQIIKPEALDLNDLIRTMGRMLERVIGEDISLRTVAQPGLNFIMADPGQLQQIVMNLAVNARDAMPQGGTLTIETANAMLSGDVCRQTDLDPGEYVVLTVSDTGCGMDAEIKQHLFEPFFTTKEVGKGTGLGLATVYGAVKQNRGAILVDSEPGQGTCFKIYLPATPALPAATEAISCPLLPGGSETILLAEDDPLMREFISDALTHLGYRVLAAASGPEALRLAHACDDGIDLLLTDVVMPGMNGRQLAERLQAERPGLKVLFASGYTQDAIVHQGVLEQHLNFIGKPFSAQSLACKLREVLERP
ncbi:MAG: Blue-light-activated protein [Deltaproteobacteria bacterium ADurb.Bin510]|nr:MAG: Blue-light-activated protein [Deltaproteobacteria bacterium ADurb.Bin510]